MNLGTRGGRGDFMDEVSFVGHMLSYTFLNCSWGPSSVLTGGLGGSEEAIVHVSSRVSG
jgi:hypothetical protein